ncbi:MAG TPA: TraR/DksA family transcriptional regulator [Actinomycetes bacterium]|jgi:DnaK suppressor protein|nr:TraR/DksA family transcriptional regulator [Actinomycetes bacterium]
MARNKQPRAASSPAQGGPEPGTTLAEDALGRYRERLQAELDELTVQAEELEQAANANTPEGSGEVGFDEEFSDAGSYTFERERDLSLSNNARDLIEKIRHALAQIDRGTFGRCETCGDPIEPDRLDALPYATLCLADARRQVRLR